MVDGAFAPKTVRIPAPRLKPAGWVLRADSQKRCSWESRWPERRRALPTPLPGAVPASSGCAGSRLANLEGGPQTNPWTACWRELVAGGSKALSEVEELPCFSFSSGRHCRVSSCRRRAHWFTTERFLRSQVLPLIPSKGTLIPGKGNSFHLKLGNGLSMQGQVETRNLP